jgi:hypothetical protein
MLENKELTKEERKFLEKYGVNEYSNNVSFRHNQIIILMSSGEKVYQRKS